SPRARRAVRNACRHPETGEKPRFSRPGQGSQTLYGGAPSRPGRTRRSAVWSSRCTRIDPADDVRPPRTRNAGRMTDNAKRASLAVALLVGGATLLAGCATVSDLLSREVTHHYEDTAAMAESDTAPPCVPDDATDIPLRTPGHADSGRSV